MRRRVPYPKTAHRKARSSSAALTPESKPEIGVSFDGLRTEIAPARPNEEEDSRSLAATTQRRRRHGVAKIGRKGEFGATRHIGRLALRLSFSLGALHLVWGLPRSACAGEPTATVLVYNQARVSRSILAAAEREAGRILDAAGVGTIWVACPTATAGAEKPCSPALKSTDVMLRVLPPPAQHRLRADVFGFAISSNLASVYYDDAVRLAVEEEYVEFDARIILGCVIAHELGHLFLGSNSHSSEGIMRSPWGQKQVQQALTGTLLFTAKQAKVLQAQARARTRPPENGRSRASKKISRSR